MRLWGPDPTFYDFFAEHAVVLVEACKEFRALTGAGPAMGVKVRRIRELEHEADVITHRCVDTLHKRFNTDIDRDSIYKLMSRLDDVVDFVEAAAERLALYELHDPKPEVEDMSAVLERAAETLRDNLIDPRPPRRTKVAKAILGRCAEMSKLENEADAIHRAAVARLFREERDPKKVIMWKEILENVETAIDRCQDVANVVEGIILEQT